jgi:hypothetical protein
MWQTATNCCVAADWRGALTVNGTLLFCLPSHRKETCHADTPLSLCRSDQEFDEQQILVRFYFNVIPEQGFSLVTFPSLALHPKNEQLTYHEVY